MITFKHVDIVRIPFGEFLLLFLQNISVDRNTGYSSCVRLRKTKFYSWFVRIVCSIHAHNSVYFGVYFMSSFSTVCSWYQILAEPLGTGTGYTGMDIIHEFLQFSSRHCLSAHHVYLDALWLLIQNRKWSFCFLSEPRDDIV